MVSTTNFKQDHTQKTLTVPEGQHKNKMSIYHILNGFEEKKNIEPFIPNVPYPALTTESYSPPIREQQPFINYTYRFYHPQSNERGCRQQVNQICQELTDICQQTQTSIPTKSYRNPLDLLATVSNRISKERTSRTYTLNVIKAKRKNTCRSSSIVTPPKTNSTSPVINSKVPVKIPELPIRTAPKSKKIIKVQTTPKKAHIAVKKQKDPFRKPHSMDGKPCNHCGAIQETPEWRTGPYGIDNKICNGCGLFYRKVKASFGQQKADLIMRYRKIVCPNNRVTPKQYDVPPEFVFPKDIG